MDSGFKTVSVIGLGYIGLPTAAILAKSGFKVIGVDINEQVIAGVNLGKINISEPDLSSLVSEVVSSNKLIAVSEPQPADVFIIAVPTPLRSGNKADIGFVSDAIEAISSVLCKGNLIIIESTSPIGTTEEMVGYLKELRPDLVFPSKEEGYTDVNIAYCPERVLPGNILNELQANDRIIGGITNNCSKKAVELYESFVHGECIVTNSRTAEMSKLTENSYRDVNIAFANELSIICSDLEIDVSELINLANHHPRVNILQPSVGVGGHCIPIDPWFIIQASKHSKLIQTARNINDYKTKWVVDKILGAVNNYETPNPIVACLGLSYKENSNDLRESAAIKIVKEIYSEIKGDLLVVEPNVSILPKDISDVKMVQLDYAKQVADIIVILVNHTEFEEGICNSDHRIIDIGA